MQDAQDFFPSCPEAFLVGLARTGERGAFEELVRRRQSAIRNLMRRCCHDETLADDLAQQVFLQVWLKIRTLKEAGAFGAWLRRLAITVWLQHQRKKDALENADEFMDDEAAPAVTPGLAMDLDAALATLPAHVRLCVVLSYAEGMSHAEIADVADLPLGTVKSHVRRGTQRLQQLLAAYREDEMTEET